MECAKIGYQDWLIATYMLTTSLKSVSSMKLHRELGITQKSAWFLAHRLRKSLEATENQFIGPQLKLTNRTSAVKSATSINTRN